MDQYLLQLETEGVNKTSVNIDECSTLEILSCINKEDKTVPNVIEQKLPEIANVVDVIQNRLKNNGHLFYFGAGTSGRLGVLDASECVPTYGVSPDLVQGYIAGGDAALRTPAEGCEDNEELGRTDVEKCGITSKDVVVGISASGSARYVIGVLNRAREAGAYTVAIVNNENSKMKDAADSCIELITGPEIISGSTRMKAGTSQKLVLNMLTTATMIQLGKVYGNLMVDLVATNKKLEDRAIRIFCKITGQPEDVAKNYLKEAGMDTKLAVMMHMSGSGVDEAKALLEENDGFLKKALKKVREEANAE